MRTAGLFVALAAATLAAAAGPPADGEAGVRLERLLAAMGGREAWAAVHSYQVEATHHEIGRAPYANSIRADFAAPRVRIEARGADFTAVRVLAGGAGWRRRDGETAPLTAEQHAAETRWWERNLYRTIHRLAARDPGLAVRAAGAHRLEVLRTDGARLNWFDLDYAGAPVRFGPGDAEDGTVFGPLVAHGPVRVPRWGTNPSGTWRYEIVRFIPSAAPLGADATDP